MNVHKIVRQLTVLCCLVALSRLEFKSLDNKSTAISLYEIEKPTQEKENPKPKRLKVYGAWIHKVRGKTKRP